MGDMTALVYLVKQGGQHLLTPESLIPPPTLTASLGTIKEHQEMEEIASRYNKASLLTDYLISLNYTFHSQNGIEYIVPPFCEIPAGSFIMGSDREADKYAYSDECPKHIASSSTFLIAKYPVTVAEYACAVRQQVIPEPYEHKSVTWSQQLQSPDQPVTSINWLEAVAYCSWLTSLLGRPIRLPSEAEWEKAARGTDGRIYPWGNDWNPDLANTPDQGPGSLTPIGYYPEGSSPYGVQDLAGGVWEWCSSLYTPYPYNPEDGRENFSIAGDRVMRGGAWYCAPYNARSACRGIGFNGQYRGGGFRIVASFN
jgi:formylglycine-generating enzyme required for sulfatase activity